MKEHLDQGTVIFLTDSVGALAEHYKRMLVVIVDCKVSSCLPRKTTAMLRGSHVHYHPLDPKNVTDKTGPVLPVWTKENIGTLVGARLRDLLDTIHSDPFRAVTEAIQ